MNSNSSDINVIAELIRNLPQIFGALGTLITAVGVILIGFWAHKAKTQSTQNAETLVGLKAQGTEHGEQIKTIGENVDGKMEQLLQARSDVADAKAEAADAKGQMMGLEKGLHLSEAKPSSAEDEVINVKLIEDSEAPPFEKEK